MRSTASPEGSCGPLLGGWKSVWPGGTRRGAPRSAASIWAGDRPARPTTRDRTRPREAFCSGRSRTPPPGVRLVRQPGLRCPWAGTRLRPTSGWKRREEEEEEGDSGDRGTPWGCCSPRDHPPPNSPPSTRSAVADNPRLAPLLDPARGGRCYRPFRPSGRPWC